MSIKLLRSSFESIRSRFQKLADDGYDPRVSFVTLTKPVWKGDGDIGDVPPIKSRTVDFYHESKQVCYYNEVSRRGLYAVDWGWELSGRIGDPRAWSSLNTEIGESWTRRMAGWIVSDNSTTVPHCERWQYVFLAKQQFPPFEKVCTDAATLIGSVFPSPIVKLAFGPNVPVNAVIFQNSGLWRDVVLLIGLQRLPGVMLTANAVAMDKYLYPISAMVPGEWTQPQQPPVWISHIDNFAAASVLAVDVLLNWLDELEADPQPLAVVTVEERQIDAAAEQSEPESGGVQSPHLKPCVVKAYSQYKKAMEEKPELKTDREAYDWYEENLEDDEKLPLLATWKKYLRIARKAFDAQKNKRGLGVETRSVVWLKTGNRTKADRL